MSARAPNWRERRTDGSPVAEHAQRPAGDHRDRRRMQLRYVPQQDAVRLRGRRRRATSSSRSSARSPTTASSALRQLLSDRFGFDLERQARCAMPSSRWRWSTASIRLPTCSTRPRPTGTASSGSTAWRRNISTARTRRSKRLRPQDHDRGRAPRAAAGLQVRHHPRAGKPGRLEQEHGWRVLAGDENFSDESIIGKDSREVQEQLAAVWIHENADLAGMRKAEVENRQGVRQPPGRPRATGLRAFPEETAAALHRSRHHQQRRISAVANRQPPLLADEGSQDHRSREAEAGPAPALGRGGALPRAKGESLTISTRRCGPTPGSNRKAPRQRPLGKRAGEHARCQRVQMERGQERQ